jgi:hypothetical protein
VTAHLIGGVKKRAAQGGPKSREERPLGQSHGRPAVARDREGAQFTLHQPSVAEIPLAKHAVIRDAAWHPIYNSIVSAECGKTNAACVHIHHELAV